MILTHAKHKTQEPITQRKDVRGSPQTRGYVHQTVASCNIIFQKGWLQFATTLLLARLWFKNSSTPHRVFHYPCHWIQ